MKKIKNGDIVGRKSYNKDVFFIVKNNKDEHNVVLEGIFERIIANSDINDLELINKGEIQKRQEIVEKKIKNEENRLDVISLPGKILHLDGDKRYSEKSSKYYQKMGIRAIVKNIPENKQPYMVYNLLELYRPDILVITGHDRNDKKRARILWYL